MHNFFLVFLLLNTASAAPVFYRGADLSFVNELESCGVTWKQNCVQKDIFSIFRDYDANIARFRVFHTSRLTDSSISNFSSNEKSGFADTESLISRARSAGFKVILDFHYSDTWADQGRQKCPSAWSAIVDNLTLLADSLYMYTKSVLSSLKSKNLSPDFIQVGNETNGGMCFGGDGMGCEPPNRMCKRFRRLDLGKSNFF